MSHAFHAQKRKEKFYKLAKERGYRSRAAFKLIQLNKKYNFLSNARACIDLCAAPGGWLQICAENMPVGSLIIGVDLLPIRPIPGVITFVDDILTQSCRHKIRQQLNQWQVDLVLHDGAPNVGGGGTWARDAYQQCELVLHSLKLASEFLVEGGTFVTKIFRSQDFIALCWVLRQFFRKVDVTKPTASRLASAEIFAVCQGYLAPKRVDPRLFDPTVVFKQAEMEAKTPNVLAPIKLGGKSKANRGGYDTDKQVIFERVPLSEFFDAVNPSTVLARANQLYFDEETEEIRSNEKLTKPEIVHLINDIKVLGRSDFTVLVRWHKKVRDFRKEEKRRQEEVLADAARRLVLGDDIDNDDESNPDRRVLTEEERDNALMELKEIVENKRRNERKKRLEARQKQLRRLAQNINNEDLSVEGDEALFSAAAAAGNLGASELGEELTEEQLQKFIETGGFSSSEESDGDDDLAVLDQSTYMKLTEESLDRYYAEYNKTRKGIIKDKTPLGLTEEANRQGDFAPIKLHDDDHDETNNNNNEADEEEDEDDRDYIASLQERALAASARSTGITGVHDSEEATASRWFGQDLFGDVDLEIDASSKKNSVASKKKQQTQKLTKEDVPELGSKRKRNAPIASVSSDEEEEEYEDDDEEEEEEEEEDEEEEGNQKNKRFQRSYDDDSDDDSNDDSDDEDDAKFASQRWDTVDPTGKAAVSSKHARHLLKMKSMEEKLAQKGKKNKGSKDDDDSEYHGKGMDSVVGAADGEANPENSGDELSEISDDEQAQAEILALGTKMIRRKDRDAIIDAAYNRYAWNDASSLPSWFVEDENQHNRAQMPVTKAEVNAVMQHLKAVNARPIKKLAEARARKKMRMMRKLDRMKIQANAIVNQQDASAEEKMKAIDKLYKMTRAKKQLKPEKKYVVASKGGTGIETKSKGGSKGGKAFTVRVDTRMKKDKRGQRLLKKRVEKQRKLRNKKRVKKSSD